MKSRRHFFKTLAATTTALGLSASLRAQPSNITQEALPVHRLSAFSYPCHGAHQAGITTPHQPFAILSAFDVQAKNVKELEQLFRILTTRIEFLTAGGELIDPDNKKLPPSGSGILGKHIPADGLSITVGVGASLFDARYGLEALKPKHLLEMPNFPNDKLKAEWCDGDFSLQICAFSPETCQNALRDIIKHLSAYAVIRWSIDGFLPKSEPGAAARNLLGFRDGTANPNVQDEALANQVLWTGVAANSLDEPSWTKNGSYQVMRFIRHFVEFWDRTPLQEQELIFGREKYSGAPLGKHNEHDTPDYAHDAQGETTPLDSHIRLANPRTPEFLARHQIFRRPFNYSRGLAKSGQLDVGLLFICYQANLNDGFVFVQDLLNFEPLEEYIQPWGGGYFFALPGWEKGEFLAQGLFSS